MKEKRTHFIACEWISLGSSSIELRGIGILLMENEMNEITCRIGGQKKELNEAQNKWWIMEHGGKLNQDQAINFFPAFKNDIQARWKY